MSLGHWSQHEPSFAKSAASESPASTSQSSRGYAAQSCDMSDPNLSHVLQCLQHRLMLKMSVNICPLLNRDDLLSLGLLHYSADSIFYRQCNCHPVQASNHGRAPSSAKARPNSHCALHEVNNALHALSPFEPELTQNATCKHSIYTTNEFI